MHSAVWQNFCPDGQPPLWHTAGHVRNGLLSAFCDPCRLAPQVNEFGG
jgi:hypothetical protein